MQDQWEIFCCQARYFTYSKFLEMKEDPKNRLLWLVDKLAALQARGAENLILGLLRQIKGKIMILNKFLYFEHRLGGDYSSDTVSLIQKLYQLFTNNRIWFNQQSQLIPFSIYSFLRVISGNGVDLGLRKELATFCSVVLQEKFKECSVIGRDLIRILQDVSRMPEFTSVWKFLYQRIGGNDFESSHLYKILQFPTPKKFVVCRLTPEMETNLIFILDHVKYGGNHHRKYYDWFSSEYLKVSDPENILIDIIRYLIVAYHPPNSVIASSSVQRWQIITWFLRQFKSNYSTTNAKLALFYDWLFYDISGDNIMNVEPAILIMTKSASVNPKITCTMIEFLYMLKRDYLPSISSAIERSIDKTMFDILSKRVVSNLESILLCDQISEEIKRQTRELFPCYSGLISIKSPNNHNSSVSGANTIASALIKIVQLIEQAINDPNAPAVDLMKKFVNELGKSEEREVEEAEGSLVQLIGFKFNNFSMKSQENWANALRVAFHDPQIEKEVIDRAVEKISLLPLTDFNIETFLICSYPIAGDDSMNLSKSTSSIITEDSYKILGNVEDDEMCNGIVDQICNSKSTNSKLFYSKCFEQFYLELSESPNVIELIGVILNDTDPSQLLCLKNQLLLSPKNPLPLNWTNLTKSLHITKNWDGYCQIFLWELLLISLKQCNDTFASFKELLQNIKAAFLTDDEFDLSEICNGLINLSISLYPKPTATSSTPTNNFNEYFHWLLLMLEEGHDNPAILHVLTFYWRSNSRFFLQCLVRLDESDPIRSTGTTATATATSKLNQYQIKNTLSSFSKLISTLEENSPAKKSLLSCIDTTIALMSK